jgi:hypothetical protein
VSLSVHARQKRFRIKNPIREAAAFFEYNQGHLAGGRMDDRCEFGYTIKVVSITGSGAQAQAVVRITRK